MARMIDRIIAGVEQIYVLRDVFINIGRRYKVNQAVRVGHQ